MRKEEILEKMRTKKLVIGIDIDGVFTEYYDFIKNKGAEWLKRHNKPAIIRNSCAQELTQLYGITEEEDNSFWEESFEEYFAGEYSKELAQWVETNQDKYEIYIMTARHNHYTKKKQREIKEVTYEALDKLGLLQVVGKERIIFTTEEKVEAMKEYGVDVMVDDSPYVFSNIRGIVPFLIVWDSPYNKCVMNCHRAYNVSDLDEYVRNINDGKPLNDKL